MKENVIGKELISLSRLVSSIHNIYVNKLYSLDLEGKKNTEEYVKFLSVLKDAAQILDNKINTYFSNPHKLSRVLQYLWDEEVFDLYMMRIMSYYDYDIMDVRDFFEIFIDSKNKMISKQNKQLFKMYKEQIEVKTWIDRSKRISFLIYLDQELEEADNLKIKKELLLLKYNMIFSNICFEEELLYKNFNIPKIMPNFMAPPLINNYDYDYYVSYRNCLGEDICNLSVDRILEEGYCASKEYVPSLYDSVMDKIYLKIGLQMIDKTSFKYLYDDTNRKIEYYERAASLCGNNNNNNSNKQLVLQLFDQGKCKYKKK